MPEARTHITAPANQVTFYLAYVTHDSQLSLRAKQSVPKENEKLLTFLQDALSTFQIFKESDPQF